MSKKVKRLFEQFQPTSYRLELTPDSKKMIFNGTVAIRGRKVGPPSQRITLHSKNLVVTSAKITKHDKKGDKGIKSSRVNLHRNFDELRLHSNEKIFPGEYTLEISFIGKISKAMQGIYPCFTKKGGHEDIIIATQFESHHAREVFPCIDEPEAKATFDLSLITPEGLTVLSNTPAKYKKTKGALTQTSFETTPIMSTYLLAFVIGNLHYEEVKSRHGVTVRTWAHINQPKSHLKYAAREAADILDFFTDYFGVPYPLKKLDQMALPDFDSAAMENWGLVTYREMVLLFDPKNSSVSSEQFASLVIAHELSHQWFGNLVTMKWWDDLWLNESFAGLMEHIAPAELHPDWHQWEMYALGDIALITSRDVYKDIQPVGVDVDDPDLIETLFDPAIVYAKGARLIKMLREYIGEEAFRKGLRAYFIQHDHANATRHDLWRVLGKVSEKNIESFMTPWLTQPGMPVLHVSQNGKSLKVVQERFLLDGQADSTLWPIPFLANQQTETDMLSNKSMNLVLPDEKFILLNQNASGQYLTHYTEPEHRAYLANALANQAISTEARINILNDIYMLARHGDSSLVDALVVVSQLSDEPRDSVWGMMVRTIASASQLTEGNEQSEKDIKKLKVKLAEDWYKKLGRNNKTGDDPNDKLLRHTVIALMIGGENEDSIKRAMAQYKKSKSLKELPAELRATILGAVVRYGPKNEWQKLLNAYEHESPELQQDICTALSLAKDPIAVKAILKKALGPKGFVRPQDVMRWLALFLRNKYSRAIAWEYMEKNWNWLEETLSASKSFDYLPTYCASVISTEKWAKKYKEFFVSKKQIKALSRNIAIGIADINARVAWRKRDEANIKQWLNNKTG